MNYKIKTIPEDFIVKEIPNKVFNKQNGKYLIYKLKKTNRNTEDCIQFICKDLKIKRKFIGFAGAKDKNAITEQFISIYNVQNIKSRVQNIEKDFNDFSLEFIGYLDSPLSLGDLNGNHFDITVRNLKDINIENPKFIINYFDDQRFGENNKDVGENIIKKDFKKAVELLKKQNHVSDEFLKLYENDYIKILRHIPKKILKMFIHAYQSFLFNEMCKKVIIGKRYSYKETKYSQGKLFFTINQPKNVNLPIIGFGSEIDEKYINLVDEILNKENITLRSFIIKQIPELSSFGTERDLTINVNNFSKSDIKDDELNKEKKKIQISFDIVKGSYATIVIKKIFTE